MSTKVNVSALAALLLQLSNQGVELVDDTVSIAASSAVVVDEEPIATPDPGVEVQPVNDEVSPELEKDIAKVVGIASIKELEEEGEKDKGEVEGSVGGGLPVDQGCGSAEPLVAVGASTKLKKKEKQKVAVPLPAVPASGVTYAEVVGSSAGSSTSSWADEVEEEERRLEAGKKPAVPVSVPPGVAQVESASSSFFKEYVRVPRVKELRRILKNICGVELPRGALQELALASVTSAVMPVAFVDGRNRLSALARVGDAAMLLVLLSDMYRKGAHASSLQAAREGRLSGYQMQTRFSACALAKHIDGATPASLKMTKTGADACEAIAGVLHLHLGPMAVGRYMQWLGL